jgi:hypothetical protein
MYNMHWMLSLCSSRTGHGKMVYFYRLTTNASYVVIMCNYVYVLLRTTARRKMGYAMRL